MAPTIKLPWEAAAKRYRHERDEARREWMEMVAHEGGIYDEDARFYAEREWGAAEAERLFPVEP